jgi:hypothetical protein
VAVGNISQLGLPAMQQQLGSHGGVVAAFASFPACPERVHLADVVQQAAPVRQHGINQLAFCAQPDGQLVGDG